MGKVQNQDFSQFDRNQWVEYLKDGAYRGAKINKMARKNTSSSKLVKDQNQIELTYGTKKITIQLAKLQKKHEDWSLSRLIHNLKMACSSTYEKDFNDRIERLADEVIKNKTLHDFVNKPGGDVKQFFLANQKLINSSIGDQQAQDDLFKLAQMANDPNLAHLIAAKATGVMPLSSDIQLPDEVQSLIFAHLGTMPLTRAMRNQWINDNHICLEQIGYQTSDEAIQHAFDQGLTSINLSAYPYVNIGELKKCTELKKLSLNTYCDLSELVNNFPKLESLSLRNCEKSSDIAKILEGHKTIKCLEIDDIVYNNLIKAIMNMDDLEALSLPKISTIPSTDIVKMLAKHTKIRELNLGYQFNDDVVKAIVKLEKLERLTLRATWESTSVSEILEKHTQLRFLSLSGKIDDKTIGLIVKLDKLEHLQLSMEEVLKMDVHPHIQTLETFSFDITMKQLEDVISKFPKLRKLVCNMSGLPLVDRRMLMDKYPYIKFIEKLDKPKHLHISMDHILTMNVNTHIESLQPYGNNITMKRLEHVISKFPKLRQLAFFVRHLPELPLVDRELLIKKYPHIQFVY